MPYKKILVCCPGNAMTAGPEAIHQLVADLIRLGQNAAVVYFPFDKTFETVGPYKKYQVPVAELEDQAGNLIIFPEIVTTYAFKIQRAAVAIWWMSVNNFTCERYQSRLRDQLRYLKYWMKGLRPTGGIKSLRSYQHFAQSHYAHNFLSQQGIDAKMLSDPIPVYTQPGYLASLQEKISSQNRKNIITYNPAKGAQITARLMNHMPEVEFVPLRGYNRHDLADLFMTSKLYMDFGHHPGKDRLPREAAIHGSCVVTGINGSAANNLDVPIDSIYKLDPNASSFLSDFKTLAYDIFAHYQDHFLRFQSYRSVIAGEQVLFDQQIKDCFEII